MKKTKNEIKKKVEEYLSKPYRIELEPDPDGGYAVWVRELPGCVSYGETVDEALKMIKEAMELWIETALKRGLKIPEPLAEKRYTGKFLVRLPSSLHEKLVETAKDEGVSLNSLVISLLSEALSSRTQRQEIKTIKNKIEKIEESFLLWNFSEKKRVFEEIQILDGKHKEHDKHGKSA